MRRAHSSMSPRPREATRHIPGAVRQYYSGTIRPAYRYVACFVRFLVGTSIHHGANYTCVTRPTLYRYVVTPTCMCHCTLVVHG